MKTIFRIMPLAVAAIIAAGCGNTGSKTAEQTAVVEDIIPTVAVERCLYAKFLRKRHIHRLSRLM